MAFNGEMYCDFAPIVEAFKSFFRMLKSDDWLSESERGHAKDCILSAREIEKITEELVRNGAYEDFENILKLNCCLPEESSQLHNACDIVLEKVLTAPGIPYSNVRLFIDNYLELCGVERLSSVLTSTILRSEMYRVILDYVASASSRQLVRVHVQAHVLSTIWERDRELENTCFFWQNWLEKDSSGHNMAAALRVIADDNSPQNLADYLASLIVTALEKRDDIAVKFWEVVLSDSTILIVFVRFSRLLEAALDFLRTSGQWMEATEAMDWISRETGPCSKLGFNSLVLVLEFFLYSKDDTLIQKAETFLHQRRNDHGCTLWDDIHFKVSDFTTIKNIEFN